MDESGCAKWGSWFFESEDLEEWIRLTRKHKKAFYFKEIDCGISWALYIADQKHNGKAPKKGVEEWYLAFSAAYAYFLDPTIDAPSGLIEALIAAKFEPTRRARLGRG